MSENSDAALAALASRGVTALPPLGLVLGSGLGGLAAELPHRSNSIRRPSRTTKLTLI